METLEKKAEEIGQASLTEIRAMSIKTPTYETLKGEDNRLGVYDMAEYSCDAACDNCHCATY
ncbi:MAG: hypothetical protein ACP5D2_03685 [Candidatus Nanoarchaeia archaeon]